MNLLLIIYITLVQSPAQSGNTKKRVFHKLKFPNLNIFATWLCKPLIFQTLTSFSTECIVCIIKGLMTPSCKDVGIKNPSLLQKLRSFDK